MATLTFDTAAPPPPPPQTQCSADGPRKRRKRAPAAGAADDCFTCANRSLKCDRRRPYCTPCLESGSDCAGYKTQLTWGVGVASRGKLRGLSLPIAGTKKVAEPAAATPKKKRTPSTSTSTRQFTSTRTSVPLSPESGTESGFKIQQLQIPRHDNVYSGSRHHAHGSRPSFGSCITSAPSSELLPSPVSSHLDASPSNFGWTNPGGVPGQLAYSLPTVSPVTYSTLGHHDQFYAQMPRTYGKAYSTMETYPSMNAMVNPAYSSDHSGSPFPHHADDHSHQRVFGHRQDGFDTSAVETQPVFASDEDIEEVQRDDKSWSDSLSVASGQLIFDMNINWTPFTGTNFVGKTPRMQYLIQYYAEVISPVIVAFDSPTNPFRDQLLGLATKSDSLQHALSALAASNLRQRQESGALSTGKTLPARRSSQAHLSLTSEAMYNGAIVPARDPKREESFHKYHAVQSLNAALANPDSRKDDSVLATLLVLCLFHMCDSGIARFQTQFAGVKKLLALRRNERGGEDSGAKWMTRLFTWFDAMAATVNEREGQFDSQSLESSAFSDEEWSFETLAGVDGRLFKTMSQLGRLNILSQGKAVQSNHTVVSRPLSLFNSPYLHPQTDPNSFDGNGWMRMIEDEQFFVSQSLHGAKGLSNPHHVDGSEQSHHVPQGQCPMSEQFWREWREVRQELQAWNLDTLLYETQAHPNGPHLTEEQRLDIDNISNAFRYSALLYTERLGNPTLPSSHEKLQYWVRRSLHHIRRVRSDVYLLWPLFITGSECVHEAARNVIRERCEDIQKDSGFVNNASCLALLERVWNNIPTVPVEPRDQTPDPGNAVFYTGHAINVTRNDELVPQTTLDNMMSGFRFRDVMTVEGNEGEWIVV